MPRKRANAPRRWWTNKKLVAKRLRAGLLASALLVAALAVVNFRVTATNAGPLGMSVTTWLYISTTILAIFGVYAIGSILWLKKHDALPKEK